MKDPKPITAQNQTVDPPTIRGCYFCGLPPIPGMQICNYHHGQRFDREPDPTPEEIAAEAERIREEWTEREFRLRSSGSGEPTVWNPPRCGNEKSTSTRIKL